MGNCCSTFRAKFRPNQDEMTLNPLPKPPMSGVSINTDGVDGVTALPSEVIQITSVDLCLKTNGDEHHTSNYDLMTRKVTPNLVVRRGQSFLLNLTLNRTYNPDTDGISFIFTVADAKKPSYGGGTLSGVPLLPHESEETNTHWSAQVEESNKNSLKVRIKSSSHCIVAEWKMDIDTKLQGNGAISYSLPTNIFILFNPWCLQDQVYLESEKHRQEYVLESSGLIWRGSYNRLRPVPWVYAQFEKDILECSLYLISKIGKVSGNSRSDPVKICRALSAAVNSPDDNGVVKGNWSNDFGSHTPPTKWVGSMKILQEYYKTKKPVKYGQCWVFSGVLATVCRAIGIPTRVVTNFKSAHDTQSSLTVDYFVDKDGVVMEEINSDSIWNFHVWNEVWMDRPDLNSGTNVEYGGWQAIDSTPQELSEDMYRCGPASVVAVKKGELLKPFDNGFLFSEVNADEIYWRYAGPTQPLKLIRKDIYAVGQLISTKAVGTMDREDITHTYKYPEKSEEERTAMLKALQQSQHLFSRYYLNEDFNDIKFDFELKDDIKIGQPFDVVLKIFNKNKSKDHSVNVIIRIETVFYTGKIQALVKRNDTTKLVKAGTVEQIIVPVTYEEYKKKLCDQCAFNIACLATVAETNFEYFAQDDFRVRKPDIKIKLQTTPQEEVECKGDVNLENPLPIPLKNGQFFIEGPGLPTQLKIKLKETIPIGGFAKAAFKFTPPSTGRYSLAVKFTSKELDDVDGFLHFLVVPKKNVNTLMGSY